MRKTFFITSAILYGFWFALFLGPIIILSIPSSAWSGADFSSFHPNNGWSVIDHYGVGNIFNAFYHNVSNHIGSDLWWFAKSGPATWKIICGTMLLFLMIVCPVFLIIFSLISYRLYYAMKYPKNIEFVDSIKQVRRQKKRLRKVKRKSARLLKKDKITELEANDKINVVNEQLKQAKLEYDKFYSIWNLRKKQSPHESRR